MRTIRNLIECGTTIALGLTALALVVGVFVLMIIGDLITSVLQIIF